MNRLLEKTQLTTLKSNLIKYKKYYLIYIVAVLISAFSLITTDTLAHPKMELIFLVLILFMGLFCLTFYFNHRDDENIYKTLFVFLIIFGMVCVFVSPICQAGDSQSIWQEPK